MIKKALRCKNDKLDVDDNRIAGKQSTCDEALAKYLIFKSKNELLVGSYIRALKLVLIMRDFLNKNGSVYAQTETNKEQQILTIDFSEV